MPGSNAGTGQPISFRCSECRKQDRWNAPKHHGFDVRLTGRTKPAKHGNAGGRNSDTMREYECLDCGHVGWSRHTDLERTKRYA